MCKYSHTQKHFIYILTHHTFTHGLPLYRPVSGLFNSRLAQPQCVAEACLEGQSFVVSWFHFRARLLLLFVQVATVSPACFVAKTNERVSVTFGIVHKTKNLW